MQQCGKAEEQKSGLDPDPSETKPKKNPHTFSFSYNNKKYSVTCDASLSVLKGLQTNIYFKGICKKEQKGGTKEVVIQRQRMPHAAVAPHFPCCLINNNEILTIRFIKPSDGSSSTAWTPELVAHTPETLVCFYIRTKGEENIRKPMKNNQLQRALDYACVYAARGEEVKAALKRDGRFNVKMFSRGALRDEETKIITDLSNLVDYLDGKQFVIVFCQHQTDSQESSQESVGTVKEEKHPVPQEEKPEGASSNAQEKKTSTKSPQEEVKWREYPKVQRIQDTQETLELLRAQYEDLLKVLEERKKLKTPAEVKRFFREEYDKNAQSFSEVKTLKTLMELSDSVCQIRRNNFPVGSGFVLFHRFVLTNAHVVKDCLSSELKAAFHFEDLTSVGSVMAVEKVVADQKGIDYMGNYVDFALLELGGDDEIPPGFLQRYSAPPARGGVCIIGHPGGGVKQMDPCFISAKEDVPLAAHEHFQKDPNPAGFNIVPLQWTNEENLRKSKIYYHTCFFHGSSGSPLFDDRCHLIGVHTGGYLYNGNGKKTRSVVEWGLPIFPILVQIYIKCSKRPEVVQYLQSLSNLKLVVQEAKKQLTANRNHPDPGDVPESMDTSE